MVCPFYDLVCPFYDLICPFYEKCPYSIFCTLLFLCSRVIPAVCIGVFAHILPKNFWLVQERDLLYYTML